MYFYVLGEQLLKSFYSIISTISLRMFNAEDKVKKRYQKFFSQLAYMKLNDGRTLLLLAFDNDNVQERGWFSMVEVLVRSGADVNAVNSNRDTALHLCVNKVSSITVLRVPLIPDLNRLLEIMLSVPFHSDIRNSKGLTVRDILMSRSSSAHYGNHPTLIGCISLRCLAAAAVQRHNILYVGEVPASLESFVRLH